MNNLPRQKLFEIIQRHGREIVNEPRRCEGLMRDNFPAFRREIAVLTTAVEERVPAELLATANSAMPQGVLLARLARRLHDDVAMEERAARWAVRTWAFALGIVSPDELIQLERADAPETTQESSRQPAAIQPRSAPSGTPPAHVSSAAPRPHAAAPPSAPAASVKPIAPARTSFVVAADGSGDFLTITDAMRRAHAGARLLVRPGVYHEGLTIDKELEIVGDGGLEEIIIRATASSVIVMNTDTATLRNVTLRGQARGGGAGGAGFFAVDIPHGRLLLDACDISSDSLSCVAIHNPSAEPVIRSCRIHHGVDSGIFAFDGARSLIEACDIFENSNVNIAIASTARVSVTNSHVHHGKDAGIVVWDRAASVIENCEIYSNVRTNIGVSDRGEISLRRCRIHGGDNTGVFAHRHGVAKIEECNIYSHAEAEVAVTSGGDVSLRGSHIHHGASHGVFVHDAGRAALEGCDVFENRSSGVHVDANGVLVARSCRINENGQVGVSCEAGGAVDVEGCDLTENRVAAWQTDHGSIVRSRNNRL